MAQDEDILEGIAALQLDDEDPLQIRVAEATIDKFCNVLEPLRQWHDDLAPVQVEDQFIDLKIITDHNGNRETPTSYRDIVLKFQESRTIHLSGNLGTGKSSLCRRMCLNWAKYCKNEDGPRDVLFEQFKIVLLVCPKEVSNGRSFSQVLQEAYKLEEQDANALYSYARKRPESVLLILDDADKYDESISKEIEDIVNGTRLESTKLLIVTSGHWEQNSDVKIKLGGLTAAGMQDYLQKVYANFDELNQLLRKIRESEELIRLSHNPAILFMMVTMWRFLSTFERNFVVHRRREQLLDFCAHLSASFQQNVINELVDGLTEIERRPQMMTLIRRDEFEVAEMHTRLQLNYLDEHLDATLMLPPVVDLQLEAVYPASLFKLYLRQNGDQVRKMRLWSSKVRHLRILYYLRAPHLTCLELSWMGEDSPDGIESCLNKKLTPTLMQFPLEELTVLGDRLYFYDENLTDIIKAVVEIGTLHVLEFRNAYLVDKPIRTLNMWLEGSHLTSLVLSDCRITRNEVMGVLCKLPPTLKILDISYHNLFGLAEKERGQLGSLTRSRLEKLDMSWCRLRPHDILAVIDASPETLANLNISSNCREGNGDDLLGITEYQAQLHRLKTVNLEDNMISDDVAMAIQENLEMYQNLKLLM